MFISKRGSVTFKKMSRFYVNKIKLCCINTILKYRPLLEVSDGELIQLLGEPFRKEEAFDEFYRRYSSFLFKVCSKSCWCFDSAGHLAEDVFQNTMMKVLAKGGAFKLPDPFDSVNAPKYIKAWLAKIAFNELQEFLRKNPDEKVLANSTRKRTSELSDSVGYQESFEEEFIAAPPSIQKENLERALGMLTDREREILMTYMQFLDPSRPNLHLPEDVLKAMCSKYCITAENVRQIKVRTLKKLEKYLHK